MARLVTRDELKEMLDRNEDLVLVNALPHDSFERERICGSINIPSDQVGPEAEDQLGETDQKIVVYCANRECSASSIAADKIEDLGYKNVMRFEGGIESWKEAGLCTEGTAVKKQKAG